MSGYPLMRRDYATSVDGFVSRLDRAVRTAQLHARRYPVLADIEATATAVADRLRGNRVGAVPDIDEAHGAIVELMQTLTGRDRRELEPIRAVLFDLIEQRDAMSQCETIRSPS